MKFPKSALLLSFFIVFLTLASGIRSQEIVRARATTDSTRSRVLRSKSPMGALWRSVAVPGWGQLYNKKYLKAGLAFGAQATFLTLLAIEWKKTNDQKRIFDSTPLNSPDKQYEYDLYKFYRDQRSLYLWSSLATIFISMFDAYVDAQLYDFDKEMENIGFEIYPNNERGLSLKLSLNF